MQLILTQSDIETALINYVNELVNIKDGMSISVDLKATRGADGATAIIDISPAKAATAKAEPVVKPQVVTNKPTPQAKAEVKADPKPEVAENNPISTAEPVEENTTGPVEDLAAEAAAVEEATEVAQEAQAEKAETEAKPKSLFEGLRKPKND